LGHAGNLHCWQTENLSLTSGYRYSYWVYTTVVSEWAELALNYSYDGSQQMDAASLSDSCYFSGCSDRNQERPCSLPLPTPRPTATPYGCSAPGVYVSKRSTLWDEYWVQTNRANVSVDRSLNVSQYLSIRGSFISDRNGSYSWLFSSPSRLYLWLDGSSISSSLDDWAKEDNQAIFRYNMTMDSGNRYSFYATTMERNERGFIWLALMESNSSLEKREHFGSSNCELCNVSGCVDLSYTRDDCPAIDERPTELPWETRTPTESA
jgi:hypothetical protein